MFLFPITVAKDQSGGRVDRLFGQLGAQQCPGGGNAVKLQFFFAVMSKLFLKMPMTIINIYNIIVISIIYHYLCAAIYNYMYIYIHIYSYVCGNPRKDAIK